MFSTCSVGCLEIILIYSKIFREINYWYINLKNLNCFDNFLNQDTFTEIHLYENTCRWFLRLLLFSRKFWTYTGVNKLRGENDMHFLRSLNQLNEYYLKNCGHTTGKHRLSLTKVCHPVTFVLLHGKQKSHNICIH